MHFNDVKPNVISKGVKSLSFELIFLLIVSKDLVSRKKVKELQQFCKLPYLYLP